ncbi:MAG: cytochrome P450, partial [Cyclobacteriaceae bacterium]|nr:cytochrome P450 [Cyclobacteriaceae bacterium]
FEIKKSDIPENIKTILAVNFKDYEIGKAEITETSSGKFYEFEIEQGEQEFEVIFDAQGNITVKKQSEEEDND